MAAEVIWLDAAKDEVRSILQYIAADNPNAAVSYISGLTETCRKLADFPRSGRRYNSEFRCIVFRNHLIFYRFEERSNRVTIAAVVDARRDVVELVGKKE